MKVGDKVRCCISSSATRQCGKMGYEEEMVKHTGTVCYIHPEGRFFTVSFQFSGGAIRECYVGGGHE